MALTTLEQNTINKGCAQAKLLIETVKPILDELNVIYDSTGGVKDTVDQSDLDSATYLSNLTKTQLDDGMYALTNTLKTDLGNVLSQLSQLAARA